MSELSKTHTYKVLNTPTLIRVNQNAIRLNQNRSVVDEFYDQLDPDGTHVITFHMDHVNYEGTPGIRCHIYCKVKDSNVPVPVYIDVTHDEFHALPTVTTEEVDGDIKILRKVIG